MAGNQTITVLEADGVTQTDVELLGMGRQGTAASKSVQLCTEDKAVLDSLATKLDTAITALQIIDNMVLAAGTANIGDVDVLTVPTDPFGANADAASVSTSISAKLKGIATALGVTALDLGAGTGGSRTLRVKLDSADTSGDEYETVAASQTTQALGATGATGDFLEGLICIVSTAATSQVQIKDGAGTAITVLPNAVGGGVGTYPIPLGITSTAGAWQITTAAGVAVLAVGSFT